MKQTTAPAWLIRGAETVDPASGRCGRADLFIRDGLIAPAPAALPRGTAVIEAEGLVAAPGFIDLHAHFREPGDEEAETVASGCAAAARGGFAAVVTMPNTRPPVDTPEAVARQRELARRCALTDLMPAAAMTLGRRGEQVADFAALAAAGAAAFTDDGSTPAREDVVRQAMRAAAALGRPVMDHALDPARSGGVMREGARSRALGVPGIPAEAESDVVARDIALARETGCAVHLQHLSAAASVDRLRAARGEGLRVSAEVTPHHLALSEGDVTPGDANFKVNPPLGTAADRAALLRGLLDGAIEAFATDHAPHAAAAKARGLAAAPFGAIGLETAAGVTYTEGVLRGGMPLLDWVRGWTTGPARILGLPAPSLAPGSPATVVLLDLRREWVVDPASFASKSRNCPFAGRRLTGRAVALFRRGRPLWRA